MIAALSHLGASIGRGLVAGAFGTVAMTLSSTAEMKIRGREASSAPANAAGKVLGVQARNPEGKKRFSTFVHYGYGTGWGAVRGLLATAGLRGAPATIAHLGLVWGSEQVMLPKLGVAPPLTEWGAQEIAVDGWHHLVYAAVTGAVFDLLDANG